MTEVMVVVGMTTEEMTEGTTEDRTDLHLTVNEGRYLFISSKFIFVNRNNSFLCKKVDFMGCFCHHKVLSKHNVLYHK